MTRYVQTTAEIKGTTECKLRRKLHNARLHAKGRGSRVNVGGWGGNAPDVASDVSESRLSWRDGSIPRREYREPVTAHDELIVKAMRDGSITPYLWC